jgi:tetratricopeptide (TPR) repeat protein
MSDQPTMVPGSLRPPAGPKTQEHGDGGKKTESASTQFKIATALTTALAVVGLVVALYFVVDHLRHPPHADQGSPADPRFDPLPYAVALAGFLLGLSLVLWSHIQKRSNDKSWKKYEHLFHEIGMGFVVSGVVLGVVELTMHYSHARHLHHMLRSHESTVDSQIQENNRLLDIRANLQSIVQATANRELPKETDFKTAICGCCNLREIVKEPALKAACDEWETTLLNRYGNLLMDQGRFLEAEERFNAALTIDEQRAQTSPNELSLRYYLAIAHQQCARAQRSQTSGWMERIACALCSQKRASKEWKAALALASDNDKPRIKGLLQRSISMEHVLGLVIATAPEVTNRKARRVALYTWWPGELHPDGSNWLDYEIALKDGGDYVIELKTDGDTLDPFLILRAPNGMYLDHNDDNGDRSRGEMDFNSRIRFKCKTSGVHRLLATSSPIAFGSRKKGAGTVVLVVRESSGTDDWTEQAMLKLQESLNGQKADGFELDATALTVGHQFLKPGATAWEQILTASLVKGETYRIIGVGDNDAELIEFKVTSAIGKELAAQTKPALPGSLEFQARESGECNVWIRLAQSKGNQHCACLAGLLKKQKSQP